MSAEQIGGAAMMGLGIASMSIPIQAAGNLLQGTRRLRAVAAHERSHRRTDHRRIPEKQRRRERQALSNVSVSSAIFGKPRRRRH